MLVEGSCGQGFDQSASGGGGLVMVHIESRLGVKTGMRRPGDGRVRGTGAGQAPLCRWPVESEFVAPNKERERT
jgi:hypothetical protein